MFSAWGSPMAGMAVETVGTQRRVRKSGRTAWECHGQGKAAEVSCTTPFGH